MPWTPLIFCSAAIRFAAATASHCVRLIECCRLRFALSSFSADVFCASLYSCAVFHIALRWSVFSSRAAWKGGRGRGRGVGGRHAGL